MTDNSLSKALRIRTSACVALIGAGGKTTTLLAIAHALTRAGIPTAITTTTKMWPPSSIPLVLWPDASSASPLTDEVAFQSPLIAVAEQVGPEGKLHGLAPDMVPQLFDRLGRQAVLCEADGAAGRSLKAHACHEPVVPPASSHVLILAGLDALGEPIESVVHRPQRFYDITGAERGALVTPKTMARALAAAATFAPSGARVAFLLNKADGPTRVERGCEVAQALSDLGIRDEVLATSYGRVVKQFPSLYSW